MKKHNDFETAFKNFVTEFGGEVLLENSKNEIADYFFREQNIVAELKCLQVDQTPEMQKKYVKIVRAWRRRTGRMPTADFLNISTAPKEIQAAWMKVLLVPLENFVRKANRQIRITKEKRNLPTAAGLLLVFNEKNALHNRPRDFQALMLQVLRKLDANKKRRFSEINGFIYFSFETVKTEKSNMSFWHATQLQNDSDEEGASKMKEFQQRLRDAWYGYLHKTTGKNIRSFNSEQ